jgi:DNA mismatch repair ATPase MutS
MVDEICLTILRMGAFDNIHAGQSTFYVELLQTSQILKDVTDKSLVILDELGRGTSTSDGSSLAYATLKHLVANVKCFTLFVTHYSMADIENEFPNVAANYHMSYLEHLREGKDLPT